MGDQVCRAHVVSRATEVLMEHQVHRVCEGLMDYLASPGPQAMWGQLVPRDIQVSQE